MKKKIFSLVVALMAIALGAQAETPIRFITQPKSINNALGVECTIHWDYVGDPKDYIFTDFRSYFEVNFDATKFEVYKCKTTQAYDESTGFYYLKPWSNLSGGVQLIGEIIRNDKASHQHLPQKNVACQVSILRMGNNQPLPPEWVSYRGWTTSINQIYDNEEDGTDIAYFIRAYNGDNYIDSELFFIRGWVDLNITYVYNLPEKFFVTEKITPQNNRQRPVSWPTPKDNGYEFDYWYYDQECTKPLLASMELTEDLVLYAKWNNNVQPDVNKDGKVDASDVTDVIDALMNK